MSSRYNNMPPDEGSSDDPNWPWYPCRTMTLNQTDLYSTPSPNDSDNSGNIPPFDEPSGAMGQGLTHQSMVDMNDFTHQSLVFDTTLLDQNCRSAPDLQYDACTSSEGTPIFQEDGLSEEYQQLLNSSGFTRGAPLDDVSNAMPHYDADLDPAPDMVYPANAFDVAFPIISPIDADMSIIPSQTLENLGSMYRRTSSHKITKINKISGRSGPLDRKTRTKVEGVRDAGACWRCRKYKKSCDKEIVCSSCQVPAFRTWPSDLGCRRERLESLVLFLIPSHMEMTLDSIPQSWSKKRTWRVLKSRSLGPNKVPDSDIQSQWKVSKEESRSVMIFGEDFTELANIAERYQSTRSSPVKAVDMSCSLLIAACKLYHCFVATEKPDENLKPGEVARRIGAVRNALRRTFVLIQQLCLSTKRTDWLPAFLSAIISTITAIVFIDLAIAIPSPMKELVWGDFNGTVQEMRGGGYGLLVDLLRASTSGVNPILQDCWAEGTANRSERQVLLGADPAAIETLKALRSWQDKRRVLLDEGRVMFATGTTRLAILPAVACLYKVFDF